jgi:glycosyltransferase involved in cell wall biosynthesis
LKYQPKTYLLLVGSGELYEELIDRSAELGVSSQVLFAGFQRGKAWSDAYRVGDLFVMPSVAEPFGLTPLESIDYGTPALVSKQSGVSEVIKNMLVVDYWDTQAMANQIVAVLESNGLKRVLIENSKSELNQLSWSQNAQALHELYQQERFSA